MIGVPLGIGRFVSVIHQKVVKASFDILKFLRVTTGPRDSQVLDLRCIAGSKVNDRLVR